MVQRFILLGFRVLVPGFSATAGKCRIRCRCGKGRRTGVAREVPPAGVGQFRGFHNGRKMQVLLPLWQGAKDRGAQRSASRRGRPVPGLPQRQENAGFAAVVARGGGARWPGKCLSQGSASSGTSATAGKCKIRCRCGKGGRARGEGPGCRKGRRAGQVGRAEAGLRSLPDDAAVEHADDAVGLLGLGLVVGHHQYGLAALLVDLVQELHDLGAHLGVQVTGGLVR